MIRASVRSAENPPAPEDASYFQPQRQRSLHPQLSVPPSAVVMLGGPSGDYRKPLPNTEMAQMIRRKEVICSFCLLSRRNRALYIHESVIPLTVTLPFILKGTF